MRIQRSIDQPIRVGMDTESRWLSHDRGLIAAWERGRQLSAEDPDLAAQARNGRLVPLPWKGGVERALKGLRKYGCFRYLAMWRGLRGEDLDIDTTKDVAVVCAEIGVEVVFTSDATKYAGAD